MSWLSVLRAPWCGLPLADIHQLVWRDLHAPIWDLISNPEQTARLSENGRARALKFIETMNPAMAALPTARFRDILEACWISLGGPACVEKAAPEDIEVFFDEVEKVASTSRILRTTKYRCFHRSARRS